MLEKIKNPIIQLLLKFAVLYVLWFLFYNVWLRGSNETQEGVQSTNIPQQEQTSALDNWVIVITTKTSVVVLEALGNKVNYDGFRTMGIEGSGGLWVGDSCNAITLIALFVGLIIVLSGIWWHKIIFILIGSLTIWILNVIRLVLLAIINTQSQALTEFNHTYTFTILVYGWIIFLWYYWIKKYADLNLKDEA